MADRDESIEWALSSMARRAVGTGRGCVTGASEPAEDASELGGAGGGGRILGLITDEGV